MSAQRAARLGLVSNDNANKLAERLMARLRIEGECWVWTGARMAVGYGQLRVGKRIECTHVVAMFLRHGAAALCAETVNHLCFNKSCCNPDHLQFASNWENILHGNTQQSTNASKTRCVNGHEFSAENTLIRADGGGRECRACHATRERLRRQNQRQTGGRR